MKDLGKVMMALGHNPTHAELREMTHAYADPDSNGQCVYLLNIIETWVRKD